MATQWFPQSQQAQQHQQAPRYQQPPQYRPPQQFQQPSQQYQQPQYQQTHHYSAQYPQLPPQQHQQPTQQYPQPQPYQQQGRYIQGQQYPQAGQYPQAQSYQQQPQQYAQTQQQGYSVYQQQYTPQQYESQQYTPQPQITTPHVAYQQPYQQQASPTNPQTPTPVTSDICYNCGNPNHFAQDCPEPKRVLPAGAVNARKFSNPLRRPKAAVRVVSQSSPLPTPRSVQVQGYSQGYPPSTYNQNGGPESHVQYSQATPTSAQSPDQHQAWEQYWQWQAYQQQQQQGQQQATPYLQQPYAVPLNRAVGPNDHYQQPSRAQTQTSHTNSNLQIYQTQPTQAQSGQTPEATAVPAHHNLHLRSNITDEPASYQRQPSVSSVSMQSQSTLTSASKKEDVKEEIDEADLSLLDIPDLPKTLSQNGENTHLPNTIVSPPVSLIGMPLPANFVVADALYPIPPPAPKTEGRCQSKYLRDVTSDMLCENIQVSKYWKDHKDDTAFLDSPDVDHVVPIDEIRAQLKERRTYGEANDDSTQQARSVSRSSIALKKDSVDARSRLEQLALEKAETLAKIAVKEKQRALKRGEQASPLSFAAGVTSSDGPTIVKEEQMTTAPSEISGRVVTYQQKTEDVLAALGVTGVPKPVTATNGAYNGSMHNQPIVARPCPVRQFGDFENISTLSYSADHGPPPPPLIWQPSLSDGADGSPFPAMPGSMNGHAFSANGAEPGSGYYNSGTDAEILSPKEAPYSQSSIRKRSYNRRDSSSSDGDTPTRRQEDEVTPKLKRRQPKVAAAYSRRW